MGSLDDSHRKICTAISMDISSIATYDWPEEWPELLPFLLKLISDQNNINGGIFLFSSLLPLIFIQFLEISQTLALNFVAKLNSSWSFEVFGSSLW